MLLRSVFCQGGGSMCDKILPIGSSFDYLFLAYLVILNSIKVKWLIYIKTSVFCFFLIIKISTRNMQLKTTDFVL